MFSIFKKKIKVVTHDGTFHADDLFACATLCIWAQIEGKHIEIIRSRDQKIIDEADIVVDTGMQYDPARNRFDHHQKGGAGAHEIFPEAAIPYASFGLIWKHYAEKITSYDVAQRIEEKMVVPIDARDNGVTILNKNKLGIVDYRVAEALSNFNPTEAEGPNFSLTQFNKALMFAKEILEREMAWAVESVEGARLVREAIKNQNNPEILILDRRITESEEEVSKNKNIKFIASKSKSSENWSVIVVRDDVEDYDSRRISFPEAWRGMKGEEFVKVSGIPGAIFCHSGGWLVKADCKQSAIELAQKALNSFNI